MKLIIVFLCFISSYAQIDSVQAVKLNLKTAIEPLDISANFPGGNEFLSGFLNSNYKIPEAVYLHKIKGTVLIQLIVEKNGELSNISILRDIGFGTGEEGIRVMKKSPKWIPAKNRNEFVRSYKVVPIIIDATK